VCFRPSSPAENRRHVSDRALEVARRTGGVVTATLLHNPTVTRGAEARLFVAVDIPAAMCAELVRWARTAASSVHAAQRAAPDLATPGATLPRARASRPSPARRSTAGGRLRLLEPDMLHLTLCFLGNRPVGEIEALGETIAGACAEAPPIGALAVGAPLWLPPRWPRVLAVELHDDDAHALAALHDSVATALAAGTKLYPDSRTGGAGWGAARRGGRFRPHVTVARLRAADTPRLRDLPATPPLSFVPETVTLFRSWLTPTEALYEGLATHALAAHG
jgi:2'-5' RNA ligase